MLMNRNFEVETWSELPEPSRPTWPELISLGLALDGISSHELPQVALQLLEEEDSSGDPDLADIATRRAPSLREQGEQLKRYFRRKGVTIPSPRDAALQVTLLRARLTLHNTGSSVLQAAHEIVEYWHPFTGQNPFPSVTEIPDEVRRMWSEFEFKHSLLFDRLGRYATNEELEVETRDRLLVLIGMFVDRVGNAGRPDNNEKGRG